MTTHPLLSWTGLGACLLSLLLAQLAALALARGLELRIPRRVRLQSALLPVVLLAVFAAQDRLLVPCDEPVARLLPDAPQVDDPDPHGILNEVVLIILPWEMEVRRAVTAGRLPLWSDLLDGGSSPWINPQAGVLSPVSVMTRFVPIEHWLLAALAVKLLLAYQGTWLLARRLGVRAASASLAALGLALGPLTPWAVFPVSAAIAFMPWLVLASLQLARQPSRRCLATTAVLCTSLLLSGHPETAFAAGLLAALCALCFGRRGSAARALRNNALAACLGGMLAAVQLVPFACALPGSQRVRLLAARANASTTHGSFFQGGREALFLRPLSPWAFGRPFHDPETGPAAWGALGAGYAGLVALAGCVAALATRGRRRRAWPFAVFAGMSLLFAAGFRPLLTVQEALPWLRSYGPNRVLPAAALALLLAGALGCDAILGRRRLADPQVIALAAVAAASFAVRLSPGIVFAWISILAAAILASRARRAAVLLLAVAALVDLVPWAYDHLPRGHRELFYPRTRAITAIQRHCSGPNCSVLGSGFAVYPSLLPMYGIADVRPHNPLAPDAQLAVLQAAFGFKPEVSRIKGAVRRTDHPLADFLGVGLLVESGQRRRHPSYARVPGPEGAPLRLFRNRQRLPRIFLPTGADVVSGDEVVAAVGALADARRVIVSSEAMGSTPVLERPWSRSAVSIVSARPGHMVFEVRAADETLVATAKPMPAGWRARNERGERLSVVTVNGAFTGVRVPAGTARV